MARIQYVFLLQLLLVPRHGKLTCGPDKYMFEIDLSKPWDTRTNFSEKRIGRFGDSSMGSNPPNMIRGGLWRGPPNDSRLFTFGGSTFLANTTDVDWKPPTDDKYSLWSYDTASMKWAQYDVSYAIPRRPNWGSVAEAVDLGIGFALNGQIDRGSSNVMYTMGEYVGGSLSNTSNEQTTYVGGLSIIDMYGKVTARNTSTESLGPPRVAGGLVYAPGFGKTVNGSLITFGGMHSVDLSNNGFRNGALVRFERPVRTDATLTEDRLDLRVCLSATHGKNKIQFGSRSQLLVKSRLPGLIFASYRCPNRQRMVLASICKCSAPVRRP